MLWNKQNNKKVVLRDWIKTILILVLSKEHNRKLDLNTSQALILSVNTATVHIWTSLLGSNVTSYPFPANRKWLQKVLLEQKPRVGNCTAGSETPPTPFHNTKKKKSSMMHLCNCIKCGQLALFSRPPAVTRYDTCNCTVRYLNKECGGLPVPREHTQKSRIKRGKKSKSTQFKRAECNRFIFSTHSASHKCIINNAIDADLLLPCSPFCCSHGQM